MQVDLLPHSLQVGLDLSNDGITDIPRNIYFIIAEDHKKIICGLIISSWQLYEQITIIELKQETRAPPGSPRIT